MPGPFLVPPLAAATPSAPLRPPVPGLAGAQPGPAAPVQALDAPTPALAAVTDSPLTVFPLLEPDGAGEGSRLSTRAWAVTAVVALLLAVAATGTAAALWHQNAQISRQVTAVQSQLHDVTGQVDGLTTNAQHAGGTADDLTSRVAAVEQATQQLGQLDGLTKRVGALETSTQQLAGKLATAAPAAGTAPAGGAGSADVAALRGQVDALKAQLGGMQSDVTALCDAWAARRGSAVC
ncbi:hypothetical protein [Xylanimonas sp. McL0601]|uniref:hypothetical protein n=1 Tax=Xylanimonas sp. McL0601 TaxID=3414739 RepID=UPI003CEAA8F3